MLRRLLLLGGSFVLVAFFAWLTVAQGPKNSDWLEIHPGILRTVQQPFGYALLDQDKALLIDCPLPPESLTSHGVKKIELVLLTHHHRDSSAALGEYLKAKIPVRANKLSAEYLTIEGVKKHWDDSLPLRSSRTGYFVHPVGFSGVDCSLNDNDSVKWGPYTLQVITTLGHSRDHTSFALTTTDKQTLIFCGDAFSTTGKLWTPYTTDWDHWTDAGLKPTYESLRKLAKLKPHILLPAHGPKLQKDVETALEQTAKAIEEVAFLRSFERYTKRLGDVPQYKFLVPKEQVGSAGDKPWSKVSDHLFITGNTYVLVSNLNKNYLVLDPWGQRSVDQLKKLVKDEGLGKLEVVMFSHAHYDHYDGVYLLPERESFSVWSLDRVAGPIREPFRWRAPFLDARSVEFNKLFKEGEQAQWGGYTFKFHHFPGQSEFTMAIETTIDKKKCLFVADNFFHQEQYSGTGGWMGLNRSFPGPYAESARKALAIQPEWILAEHGGPYEFNAEDYRRRVRWGEDSVKAVDAISPSGNHRRDWDPNRITAEPILIKAKAGGEISFQIHANNPTGQAEKIKLHLQGRGIFPDQKWETIVGAGKTTSQPVRISLTKDLAKGKHIFPIVPTDGQGHDTTDAFFVVEVE